jgi:hypothetical protein
MTLEGGDGGNWRPKKITKPATTLERRIIDLENRVKELGELLAQHGEAVWDLQRIAGVLKPAKPKTKPKAKRS